MSLPLDDITSFNRSRLRPTQTRETYLTAITGSIDNNHFVVPPFSDLYISSVDGAHNWEAIQLNGITHILCVAPELEHKFADKNIIYHQEDILDTNEEDLSKFMKSCIQFIDDARQKGGKVLVHCQAGISRSASVCILYTMYKQGLDYEQAYNSLKRSRTVICPNRGFVAQLKKLHSEDFKFLQL